MYLSIVEVTFKKILELMAEDILSFSKKAIKKNTTSFWIYRGTTIKELAYLINITLG